MKKRKKIFSSSGGDNYLIDQSGKIEHTSKPTVVTLANGKVLTIKISTVEKRKLVNAMKEIDFPKRFYIYKIFATLIFILLRKAGIKRVIIDREYPGHESIVKDMLIYLFAKNNLNLPEIEFGLVGKKVQAHIKGLATYQEKVKPTIIVKAEELLEVIYGTKKGRRSQSSRDNP